MANFTKASDDGQNVFGNWRTVVGVYTGPVSYITGGDSITPTTFGLSDLRYLVLGPAYGGSSGAYGLILNSAKTKIIWWDFSNGVEVPANTTLSAFTAQLLAIGR